MLLDTAQALRREAMLHRRGSSEQKSRVREDVGQRRLDREDVAQEERAESRSNAQKRRLRQEVLHQRSGSEKRLKRKFVEVAEKRDSF